MKSISLFNKSSKIIILLLISITVFFSSCISLITLESVHPGYKKDKIISQKGYYDSLTNSVAIEVKGKLARTHKKASYQYKINMDTLFIMIDNSYNPEDTLYDYYTAKAGINGIYIDRKYEDTTYTCSVTIYRWALTKGGIDTTRFIPIEYKAEPFYYSNSSSKTTLYEWEGNLKPIKNHSNSFVRIRIDRYQKSDWYKYLYLPITVPLDIATLPIQVILVIYIGHQFKKSFH